MGHDVRADPCGGGKNSFGYLNISGRRGQGVRRSEPTHRAACARPAPCVHAENPTLSALIVHT